MMYPDLPFLDRFEAAAKDGFTAVEYLFPYAFAKEELVERLQANNLQQVLFNAPPGGTDAASIDRAWNGGDKGITCIPGREDEFRAGVALALDYAQALGCPRIHLMAGLLPRGRQPRGGATHLRGPTCAGPPLRPPDMVATC
jgi:hydroxypyruvate isomerase